MRETDRAWLTPEAFQRLRTELTGLIEQETRGGDGGDAEVLMEGTRRKARIRELRELLHNAVVGRTPPDDGIAEPGMVLTIRFDDDAETETFLLGVRDGGDTGDLEVYSPDSPLGQALSGARQGEQRSYQVPSGRTVWVTLVRAVPYGDHIPDPA
jgi:transcription elongation factor GreA